MKKRKVRHAVEVANYFSDRFYGQGTSQQFLRARVVAENEFFEKNERHELVRIVVVVSVYESRFCFAERAFFETKSARPHAAVAAPEIVGAYDRRAVEAQIVGSGIEKTNVISAIVKKREKSFVVRFCRDLKHLSFARGDSGYVQVAKFCLYGQLVYFVGGFDDEKIPAFSAQGDEVRYVARAKFFLSDNERSVVCRTRGKRFYFFVYFIKRDLNSLKKNI